MSPFTFQQLWLSRQEAALNPHTLYFGYAHDPTSPPLHLVVLLYSQQHTLSTPLSIQEANPPPPPSHPPVFDVKPSRKLITLFASCILTVRCLCH